MKITDILEARYYGRHTPVSVGLRLNKIARKYNAVENVRVLDVYHPSDDVMYTKLYIVNADSAQHAENEVRSFLKKFGIPHTQISDVTSYHDAWEASMKYKPKGQVTEAKYYGKHSPEDVKDRLDQTAYKHNKWENVRVLEAWLADRPSRQGDIPVMHVKEPFVNPVVFAHVYVVNADSEQDAENEIRLYLKKFGIPFTGIEDLEEYPTPINDQRSAWEATVRYDPGAQSERQ